jgi:hypothetical protein
MTSAYLLIILIGTGAQAIEMPNQTECMQLKEYADQQIKEHPDLPRSMTGCFRSLSKSVGKES